MKDASIHQPRTGKYQQILNYKITTREIVFLTLGILCLSPLVSPPIALLLGLLTATFIGHPYLHLNHKATRLLLQISVVGLGFGIHADKALNAGKEGLLLSLLTITGTLALGFVIGRLFKIDKKLTHLISAGTAICGGSAIAAISPVIKAEEKQISVALGTVFVLNSVALFLFPAIGHLLNLSQEQFGLWSAIAIHDTSSVVGAASKYGTEALEIATTVKLARTLWIIPVAFLSAFMFKNKQAKIKWPYFILFFIITMFINSYIPEIQKFSLFISQAAKTGLTLTLFLIGSGLSPQMIKSVGFKPFLLGITLWIAISLLTLCIIIR